MGHDYVMKIEYNNLIVYAIKRYRNGIASDGDYF